MLLLLLLLFASNPATEFLWHDLFLQRMTFYNVLFFFVSGIKLF